MQPEEALPVSPGYNPKKDLGYFIRSIGKRFPEHSEDEVQAVVTKVRNDLAPSRDRALLKREVLRFMARSRAAHKPSAPLPV